MLTSIVCFGTVWTRDSIGGAQIQVMVLASMLFLL